MTNEKNKSQSMWTPANVVTVIRILGVPIFVIALLSPWPQWFPQFPELEFWKPWVAVIIFVLLAVTDKVDGYLARSRNEVTTFGKFVDPLADKILVAGALLALVELSILPSWVALVILAREFIVSGLRMIAASEGYVVAASWYGKAKTVFQIIAIVAFLLKDTCLNATSPDSPWYLLAWALMVIALVLTIVSMIDYFVKCLPMLNGTSKKDEGAEAGAGEHDSEREDTEDVVSCESAAAEVIKAYLESGKTIATAESLTGGMISEMLTSVPGSSSVVKGGIVSYTFDVKEGLLGVPGDVLADKGAVCPEVAEQMARGCREKTGADCVVAVTGIAGPGGAEPGKPVGTVWMGVADASGVKSLELHFDGDRDSVRHATTKRALQALLESLSV